MCLSFFDVCWLFESLQLFAKDSSILRMDTCCTMVPLCSPLLSTPVRRASILLGTASEGVLSLDGPEKHQCANVSESKTLCSLVLIALQHIN